MTITAAVRKLRIRSGLTVRETAERGGWKTGSGYQRYEDPTLFREDKISLKVAGKLCAAFEGLGSPQISRDELWRLRSRKG